MPLISSEYSEVQAATIAALAKARGVLPPDIQKTATLNEIAKNFVLWGSFMGVCADYSPRNLDMCNRIGVKWFRSSPEYGWGVTPAMIKAQTDDMHSRGIRHLVVVQDGGSVPHNYDDVLTDPIYRAKFIAWIASLAPNCDAIEIGNEWNLGPTQKIFWTGSFDKTWKLQAQLMVDVAVAVRKASPLCLIVTAGFSPYGPDDGGTWAIWPQKAIPLLLTEIDRIAKYRGLTGASQILDGIGQHLYCSPEDPRMGPSTSHPGWWAPKRNRDVWASIASYKIPIWNTEFGSKLGSFSGDTLKRAQHFKWYFEEFESQKAAGILFGPHIVISKSAFDGEWTLDPAAEEVFKVQALKTW